MGYETELTELTGPSGKSFKVYENTSGNIQLEVNGTYRTSGNSVVIAATNPVTGEITFSAGSNTLPSPVATANSAVLVGDSITGYYNFPLTVLSATRTSNVVTATITNHGLVDQQRIRVYGITNDDTFNGYYTVTRVNANTITFPSVGADGSASGISMRAYNRQQTSDQGWFVWANMLLGQRFNLLNNAAYGGATIEAMIADIPTNVTPYAPAYVFAMAGINDLTGSSTPDQVITKLKQLYGNLLATGAKVVAMTILPLGSGYSGYASTAYKIPIVNDWIRRYASQTNGMILVDSYAAVVNPVAGTAGAAFSDYLSDNLHPSAKGAYYIGKAVKTALQNVVPSLSTLVCGNGDNYGVNSSNSNILDNGVWAATGGTVGTNASGVAASGFTIETSNAATTLVGSVPSRADGFGYDQRVVITPGGVHIATVRYNLNNGRWVLGGTYQIEFEMSLSGMSGSNLAAIQTYINGTGYGATLNLGISNGLSLTTFPAEDATITFRSEKFTLPSDSYTVPWLYISLRFSAAGTALTAKIGRVSVRKV